MRKLQRETDELSIAIVGKTNSGKSTIFNLINKNEVSLTGSEPNLTRDSVESYTNLNKLNFKIFDKQQVFQISYLECIK